MANCHVCFRHCEINEGELGFCGARTVRDGKVVAYNYGKVSSLALDPIEKKPLNNFFPGSYILSVGSFGCNLRCPFCQNNEISWSEEAKMYAKDAEVITPKELVEIAIETKAKGNIGIAFTYNEPLVGYEFVLDTARLAKEHDLKTVMVTAGTAELSVLDELAPYIDAMNIDLKGFTDDYYKRVIGGNREQTMAFIEGAAKNCHVELTTLIIPGENDSEEEIRELSKWVKDLEVITGKKIPLHISRFFPRFKMTDRDATDVQKVYRLAEVARENLEFVYTGNC
ncbi:AmmeMemoRadiSam system radical SAM enzyme [Butyrivibrio sp. XB500-5]|uniref:AmmeMemoRadiSam system radical SAM enzyme n=1 Tax=Butyrivibrio sp. XB500-5 TaxID=2364880 RepID=UPI000EA9BE09|nr:AmmeMemoRadiSam system radical SAM enzyme [Butyrivibrio sp. XB500-5]RKM61730.1 AmmeMemoRadiSam system radical SAM enzyme [Butyrivibrio sp. XB500-5]